MRDVIYELLFVLTVLVLPYAQRDAEAYAKTGHNEHDNRTDQETISQINNKQLPNKKIKDFI